ncbi:hypothetical protein [Christiangramia aquimixticola]|uniref:hypothetical protein n=1 Tax=Christiangramia aquimixticola TaxID=1697558 RepID=UPI003AA87A69
MDPFLFSLGLIITLATIYDMIITILAPRGAGIIADRVSRFIWRISLKLAGKDGRKEFLRFIGPLVLIFIVIIWILLLWIGNTFIVYSDPEALWSSAEKTFITSFIEKAYFSAYVLSSMGNGDYTPHTDFWLLYTGFISYTGVVFISLGISFLLPVIEAITLKRQLSILIHNLGNTPRAILENYQHDNFKDFTERLGDLEQLLVQISQYHLAYPVIHYFHSTKTYEALSVQLVSLDECMSILKYKINNENIENRSNLERAYNAMTYYLSTLASAFITPEDDEPEHPDVSYLNDFDADKVKMSESDKKNLETRRKLLLAYLQNDGWSWDVLYSTREDINVRNFQN